MFLHTLTVLVGYMAASSARETVRPMPTITNSLVNLGKMEVSFYFSGNGPDGHPHMMKPEHGPSFPPPFPSKLETIFEEPCPCSNLRNGKDSFLTNPTGLFNKIISGSDLFSINNDPVRSTMCCDSHVHVSEGSVYFELSPELKPFKHSPVRSSPLPMMPFLFESVIPNKSMLPPTRTKEIFLFPKKKDMAIVMSDFDKEKSRFSSKKRDQVSRDITVVGDKKLENNINLFKPPPPVKKDLSAQVKKAKENENEKPAEESDKIVVEPSSKPNTV